MLFVTQSLKFPPFVDPEKMGLQKHIINHQLPNHAPIQLAEVDMPEPMLCRETKNMCNFKGSRYKQHPSAESDQAHRKFKLFSG